VALQIGTFGGASALPLVVAARIGAIERRGLEVEVSRTADSAHLRDELRTGRLAIVHLAPDNVIAWSDDGGAPVRAWLGGSAGPISLVTRSAGSVAELRGARIGVDSPQGGFVPILRQLLDVNGVDPDDVELVTLGATRLRYVGFREGAVEATLLTMPWSLLAQRSGGLILGDHIDVAPDLLTGCAASLPTWLDANVDVANLYADAIDEAVQWLHEPANAAQGSELLAKSMDIEPTLAAEVLVAMLDPGRGWPTESRLRGPELRATWSLRAQAMKPPLAQPETYVQPLATT
jgi:ABC-type nitrate/sulfonate/bicarbonate transport system substrate-binding protein